jgi:predicted aconitase with swiveling domain
MGRFGIGKEGTPMSREAGTPRVLRARVLAAGAAAGEALVLRQALSLWGGMDPVSGRLVDAHHPQVGALLGGRILVLPSARGSSSSSSVLAEAVRRGTAPAALLLGEPDLILAIGAAVAEELYGVSVPVLHVDAAQLAALPDGAWLQIAEDGTIRVR